jgi:hypothetical protein
MSPQDALAAAHSILDKRVGEKEIRVLVDNPNDCHATVKAFRSLGCRVKETKDGTVLLITRPD